MPLSYDDYRDGDPSDDSELLEWCMFENLNTNNGQYFSLPMVRSHKEEAYRKLYFEDKEFESKYETGELKRYVTDTRKELSCHYYKHMEDFIKQNESREVLDRFRKMYDYFPERLIRDNEEEQEESDIVSQVENIMFQLAGIKEKIPVEANDDWRVGLIEAYEKYEQRQLLNGLKYAYSEYRMKIDLNLGFEKKEDTDSTDRSDFARKQILRGRTLNGEPEDFNF